MCVRRVQFRELSRHIFGSNMLLENMLTDPGGIVPTTPPFLKNAMLGKPSTLVRHVRKFKDFARPSRGERSQQDLAAETPDTAGPALLPSFFEIMVP